MPELFIVVAGVLGVVTSGPFVGSSASVVLLTSNKQIAETLSKQKIDLTERDLVFLDMVFYFWVIEREVWVIEVWEWLDTSSFEMRLATSS